MKPENTDLSTTYNKVLTPLDLLKYFLVTSITYWLINFVFTPNTLSPLHHDDYSMLGSGFENLHWLVPRPVSTNLVYFMGEMGPVFSFSLINLLTVALPALVLYFVTCFMQVRIGWPLVVAFSVMVFSHPAAFEHGKYLGLITNLTSHFLGCIALIILLQIRRKPTFTNSVLAVVTYGLSVFAKEDFLLPPLLLLAYFNIDFYCLGAKNIIVVTGYQAIQKKWWLKISLWFIALAVASVLFSALVNNPFLAGIVGEVESTGHYAVSFNSSALIVAFWKLAVRYSIWHTLAGVLAFIGLVVFWKKRRSELFLLAMIVFCLILPYALIFNSILPYRVFPWLPWLSSLPVVTTMLLWYGEIKISFGGSSTKTLVVIMFLTLLLTGYLNNSRRLMVATWYASNQQTNQLMLDSILANKVLLNTQEVVGIVGIEGLSPWSNSNGAYLRKLGFENHWIVFVNESTMFFTVTDFASSSYLSVVLSQRLCDQPGLLVMKFDSAGKGIALRAGELCAMSDVEK